MALSLYNTLSGRVEPFAPERPPEVRMYVCGLTVYGRGHIGNYRTLRGHGPAAPHPAVQGLAR